MTNQNASSAMAAGGRRIQSRVHSRVDGAAAGTFRFDAPSERAPEPTSESQTADVSRLAAGYATDSQFRAWLKGAARRSERLRKAIEARSLRLITDVPSPSLRKAVDRYLRSPHVQLFHLHREWMSNKGALSEQPTLLRQASFYSLWRAREDGGAMPWELDPSKRCDEQFEMRGARKRGGYEVGGGQVLRESWRTFFAFRIACRTRQKIVDAALEASTCQQYRTQFMFADGGRIEAIDEIVAAINSDPSLTHYAKLDLANCFDNIDLSRAHEVLPVRRKVVQHTIGINKEEAIDRRESEHSRYDRLMRARAGIVPSDRMSDAITRSSTGSFATRYPLMLPQGAATSPRVAYWLIEQGLPPMNHPQEVMYGDDLFILGQSEQEVIAQASKFRNLFWRHAAGPLQIGSAETGELLGGADFLGVNISRSMHRNRPSLLQAPRASVTISEVSHARFVANVRTKVGNDVACHDPDLSSTCKYVRAFLNSCPATDARALVRRACELGHEAGADPRAIMRGVAISSEFAREPSLQGGRAFNLAAR